MATSLPDYPDRKLQCIAFLLTRKQICKHFLQLLSIPYNAHACYCTVVSIQAGCLPLSSHTVMNICDKAIVMQQSSMLGTIILIQSSHQAATHHLPVYGGKNALTHRSYDNHIDKAD